MEIRNNEQLIECINQGKRLKYVFFWGHRQTTDGTISKSCFSQWYPAPFTIEGADYPTAEHYMMAEKARLFGDQAMVKKICQAKSPGAAKNFGRQVQGFNEDTWNEHRFDIVCRANLAKFSQHPELKQFLLNTGTKVLIEASPFDRIWGIGMAADHANSHNPRLWKGLNLLGYALMTVRTQLVE
ncbi:NADAR family protein [Marinicella meishanensis]|uniref:NADAR family protein n=1 Tax=Marinicella meishanensis TaxID=2873263 RepID=UPI001CC11B95|nr:NADAR family protein [Marinicella sp. NBU2979]